MLNMSTYLGGLEYLMNPAIAPFLMTIQMMLQLLDAPEPDDPDKTDVRFLLAQYISRYTGVGGGLLTNAITSLATGTEEDIVKMGTPRNVKLVQRVGETMSTADDSYQSIARTTNLGIYFFTGTYLKKNVLNVSWRTPFEITIPYAPNIVDWFISDQEQQMEEKMNAKKYRKDVKMKMIENQIKQNENKLR